MSDTVALPLLGRISPPLRHALAVLMPGRAVETSVDLGSQRASFEEHGAWERERLVLAVAALLSPPARTQPTVVVIEDLHWADPFTLDLLTYLVAGTRTGATLVVTLRTDQRPMPPVVVEVVAELQRLEGTVTIELGPLPPDVIAQQAEELLGLAGSPRLVANLVQLGGGNPFFTEQLCRQASTTGSAGSRNVAGALPAQLSGFLQSRVRGLSVPARRALLVLAVAGSPLSAAELSTAAELSERDAAGVVRELSDAALLAPAETAHVAPRHALLAAAVTEAADPLTLAWAHAQMGSLLDSIGDPARAVAAAGHWAAAGREPEEVHATLVAGPVAESMADFPLAAALWTRAYELVQKFPDRAATAGMSALAVAVAAVETLARAGLFEEGTAALAEDAFARFAPVEETLLGGTLRWWVGLFRSFDDRAAGAAVLSDAVRVLSGCEPSAALARSLTRLGRLEDDSGRADLALPLLERAVSVARSCGSADAEVLATSALGQILLSRGQVDEAIARSITLSGRPDISADARARCILAVFESDVLLRTGKLEQARSIAWAAYELVVREGYGRTFDASILRYNAGEAELELGRSGHLRELVDSVTTGSVPSVSTTGDHLLRALADLNDGQIPQALERIELVSAVSRAGTTTDDIRLTAQAAAAILLWARQPDRALASVMTDLDLLAGTDQQGRCGELLTLGAAAVADLCTQARARADTEGLAQSKRDLDRLVRLARAAQPGPFEPLLDGGREGADGKQWQGELSRASGASDPDLWRSAARMWEEQLRAHRAAYCWWRVAQAQVARGEPPSTIAAALQRAHELSAEMQPLRDAVDEIARRAHIRLTVRPATLGRATSVGLPVALTARELEILRHVAAGRSNAQIAHDLFISPKTVSVHVSNLLRKIGVSNRLQAAGWAEEVGALGTGPSGQP